MTSPAAMDRAHRLPGALDDALNAALTRAIAEDWAARLWKRDTSLWTRDERVAALIADRLGWLDLPSAFADRIEILEAFARGIRDEGFTHALVCGMGGSSLAPDVLAASVGTGESGIALGILDSTDPAAVRDATGASDPARALYLIASKSGTTTESLAFLAHFWQVEDDLHADIPQGLAGAHFAAISDPAPSITAIPHNDLFREVFLNPADVGGRYSALSYVGLVPAALLGHDLRALLGGAEQMADQTRSSDADNPALWLGVALGTLAQNGRDKLTLVIEPWAARLGAWIEQLVAESTGKRGVGVVPIDGEPLGSPDVYSADRAFVRLSSGADDAWQARTDRALDALAEAGHPVIDLTLGPGVAGLGAEFFRWEFATAVAGAVLGVNPFDEPNVTESKDNTKRVLAAFRETGSLPTDEPLAGEGPLTLVGDAPLRLTAGHDGLANELRRHLARAKRNGFISVAAYIAATPERDAALRNIATLIRDRTQRAVTVGYGPRFLHSTGQLHKGGAPIGTFIQLTADHAADLPIPGWHETFGTLIAAQAAGDFAALEAHDLPAARVNLSADPDAGLEALRDALDAALATPLN
jgi:glucose-6-phosphate isomerase